MKIYNKRDLHDYMDNDWILELLKENEAACESEIRTNRWLKEMEGKRMIYADMYGDLLKGENKNTCVLDIGGGYNALTKILASRCRYTLLDFQAHDCLAGGVLLNLIEEHHINCVNEDWYKCSTNDAYDVIIANDIFPDVDQRLELFLDRYLSRCREMRILLTFYNKPRFYTTKRIDDTEILTFLSWDGEITAQKLKKYEKYFIQDHRECLDDCTKNMDSIFWNGRQCAYLRMTGKLHRG